MCVMRGTHDVNFVTTAKEEATPEVSSSAVGSGISGQGSTEAVDAVPAAAEGTVWQSGGCVEPVVVV